MAMEKLGEVMAEYEKLGELAVKLVRYRYLVMNSILFPVVGLAVTVIWLLWSVIAVFFKPEIGVEFYVLIWLSFFVPIYFIVMVLLKIFWKNILFISKYSAAKGLKKKWYGYVFNIAFSIPFILAYAIPPLLPLWRMYSWYIALLTAYATIALTYERDLRKNLPEFSTRAYALASTLMAGGLPLIFYTVYTIGDSDITAKISFILAAVVLLFVGITELSRAERLE